MGMFDRVIYEASCERCGGPLSDFQSKDAECTLDYIEPIEVQTIVTHIVYSQ